MKSSDELVHCLYPLGLRGFLRLVPTRSLMDGSKDRLRLKQVTMVEWLTQLFWKHSARFAVWITKGSVRFAVRFAVWITEGLLSVWFTSLFHRSWTCFNGSVSVFRSRFFLGRFVFDWASLRNELLAASLCQCTVGKPLILQNELQSSSFTFLPLHWLWHDSSVRLNSSILQWLITDSKNFLSFLLLLRQLLSTFLLLLSVSRSWRSSSSWLTTTFRKSSAVMVVENESHLLEPRACPAWGPSPDSPSPSLPARAGTRDSEKEMRPSDCSSTLEGGWSDEDTDDIWWSQFKWHSLK